MAIHTAQVDVAPGSSADATAACPATQRATGGGFAAANGVQATTSAPAFRTVNGVDVPVGWAVSFHSDSAQAITATVNVICLS